MFFAALIISMVLARAFRGCVKWVIIAALLTWIANRDPILASKVSGLASEAWHSLREFIVNYHD